MSDPTALSPWCAAAETAGDRASVVVRLICRLLVLLLCSRCCCGLCRSLVVVLWRALCVVAVGHGCAAVVLLRFFLLLFVAVAVAALGRRVLGRDLVCERRERAEKDRRLALPRQLARLRAVRGRVVVEHRQPEVLVRAPARGQEAVAHSRAERRAERRLVPREAEVAQARDDARCVCGASRRVTGRDSGAQRVGCGDGSESTH